MATSFDIVEDYALSQIDDWAFKNLYNKSYEKFQKVCDSFLITAIPYFSDCRTSLSYDLEQREFIEDLSQEEISIIGDFLIIQWFSKRTNDATQFQNGLQNSGSFKPFSPSQNLKEKTSWLDRLRERVYQRITDYQIRDLDNISL